MGKINVLSFEIANLIAAGEVVERPASVLKELVENSIDAGATRIVAEIKRGGVSLIRVTDNGCGITAEDLPVALKRHATSKIREKEDLASIMTLGFRGEALAAISSVSKVTVITKTADAKEGTMLVSEGGEILDISSVGASIGTTVVVEDLFYNVPARRKFLKKDATEAMNVAAMLERVALSRPDVSIQLLVDSEERFKTPGDGKLKNAICAVYGREFSAKLLSVDAKAEGIEVAGFVGRSDNVRKNRNLQNVFINGRYVKSLTVMAALEKAYTSYIAPECFPTCVLFLSMHPTFVDVNVHPAKLEVKFSEERTVFEAVYHAVRRTLEEAAFRPDLPMGDARGAQKRMTNAFVPVLEKSSAEQLSVLSSQKAEPPLRVSMPPFVSQRNADGTAKGALAYGGAKGTSVSQKKKEPLAEEQLTPAASIDILEKYKAVTEDPRPTRVADATADIPNVYAGSFIPPVQTVSVEEDVVSVRPSYRFIGEIFDCYLMVEMEQELIIIDKHAAHERLIFEDLKALREKDGRIGSQSLLLPLSVRLDAQSLAAAEEYEQDFISVGFSFTLNARGAELSAVPDALSTKDAEALFESMADELAKGRGNPALTEALRRERSLYQIACKAAIKGGRRYGSEISDYLIGRLLSLPDITVCPHGRPVAYRLTKREMDRHFERIK